MLRCALLGMNTSPNHAALVDEERLVAAPLAALGIQLEEVSWHDRSVRWADYAGVVVRTTWDYQHHLDAFLATLEEIARATRLENALPILRRNVRKSYLAELQRAGLDIVPTQFHEHGLRGTWRDHFAALGSDELVIKPLVGANAGDTFRFRPSDPPAPIEAKFHARPCILQTYLSTIETFGERSLVFFAGEYSHAVTKLPAAGDFRVQEDHGGRVVPCEPSEAEQTLARRALQEVGLDALYARVDLVRDGADVPRIMEIELVEPSLFLRHDARAADRFARAIAARLDA